MHQWPTIAVVWSNNVNHPEITKAVFDRSMAASTLFRPSKGITVEDHGTFLAWVFCNYSHGGNEGMGAWQMSADNKLGNPPEIRVNLGLDFSTPAATANSLRIPPGAFQDTVALAERGVGGKLAKLINGVRIERLGVVQTRACLQCLNAKTPKTPCMRLDDGLIKCQWCTSQGSDCDWPSNDSDTESTSTSDEDEYDNGRRKAKGRNKAPAKSLKSIHEKSLAGTKSATKQSGGSSNVFTGKVKQRPKPRVSEGGSFYPTFDDEKTEHSMLGADEEETDADDDACAMLPPNSKSRFSSSNSMELNDSDKFQGNKGPSMPYIASQEDQPFMSSQVTSS